VLASVLPLRAALVNGDFEQGSNGSWVESSTHFGTVICDVGVCGTNSGQQGPHSGSWWALFGGTNPPDNTPEDSSISQQFAFPTVPGFLDFWFWIGNRQGTLNDSFKVLVDASTIFQVTPLTPDFFSYNKVSLNIAPFSDGAMHTLAFVFHSDVGSENVVMSLDDVSVRTSPEPATWCLMAAGLMFVLFRGSRYTATAHCARLTSNKRVN
jgi:hypothetical protein